jgi:hypothetical protein
MDARTIKVIKEGSSQSKILTHFIKGKISLSPMETILSILGKFEYLESLVKLTRKKRDESVKTTNLVKLDEIATIRHIYINKSHKSKSLHLLVQVGNNLVERLVDTNAFMLAKVV